MVESRLHDLFKQLLVASQVGGFVAGHPYHGAFHLGGRVEHVLVHRKEVFHLVPGLNQYAQDAVRLASGAGGDAFGHFFLYHSCAARNQVFVIQHLEKNLARYVIRVVACQYKRLSVENVFQFQLEEVVFDDVSFEGGEVFFQISHRFEVQLHDFHFAVLLHQELGEYAHTRAYFQNRQFGTRVHRVGNVVCDA